MLALLQDPDAKKPEDWDEREFIDDPADSKPADWEQPEHIADKVSEEKATALKSIVYRTRRSRRTGMTKWTESGSRP